MRELVQNHTIRFTDGSSAVIKKELGRGGQGIVYLVDHDGCDMAFKWYTCDVSDGFYDNLESNIKAGSPASMFLWPKKISTKENGSFGYLMDLRPSNYHDFSRFLLAKCRFKSVYAMTVAAMEICEGFKSLHAKGLSYQDLNDGNFFIDPNTGHVLICDNDNVVPFGSTSGIHGKARYMAPEVVSGEKNPNAHSDKFSMAVILFMLFYMNHPFEGQRVLACPAMTDDYIKKFYGSDMVFIYSEEDDRNRPVSNVHTNVYRRWPLFPDILKDTFIKEFSREKLYDGPTRRLTDLQWQNIITSVRDSLAICPHCMQETFINAEKGQIICQECGKEIEKMGILRLDKKRKIVLTLGKKIYIDRDEKMDAEVVRGPQDKDNLYIKNLSSSIWRVTTPSGKLKEVAPGGLMPANKGLKIDFVSFNKSGEIIE